MLLARKKKKQKKPAKKPSSAAAPKNDHFCEVKAEDVKCGTPEDYFKQSEVLFNCNKELMTRCEVTCKEGVSSTDFVQCDINKKNVTWFPRLITCDAKERKNRTNQRCKYKQKF